jgi:methylmalonyl-CoA mutase
MQEAGATAVQELAFTLADGIAYVKAAQSKGLDIDDFAPRLSFFFAIGMNFFMEVAKLRAARQMWARIMKDLGAKKTESLMLRTHCQTSGVSLTEQDPYNNIVRTAYEAMAAVLGGTQSLHTNSFDEAIALPTETSARIARTTQLILQTETKVTQVVDPLGGSYYVETLTAQLVERAWQFFEEIEQQGGFLATLDSGWLHARAAENQHAEFMAQDSGERVIVGVTDHREDISPYAVDGFMGVDDAFDVAIARLEEVRRTRGERRAGDPPALFADPGAIQRDLGWKARFTGLDEIVATAWRWHQSNPNGYR